MRKIFVITLVLLLNLNCFAQQYSDAELQHLVDMVASLRKPDLQEQEKAWDDVSELLAVDKSWTIMDELKMHKNECRLSDTTVRWFAINNILTKRMGFTINKVRGDFNNGEDPNFNYSLIEKSVKANKTVDYEIKLREGEQMIVIMPYDIEASDLTAEVFRNGISLAQAEKKDGNLYLHIGKEAGVTLTDVLDIVITNNSDKNTAIVIVNHNTRKKQ